MVSELFFYQLVLIALVWLCCMLHWVWPSDGGATSQTPSQPTPPLRRRSRDARRLLVGAVGGSAQVLGIRRRVRVLAVHPIAALDRRDRLADVLIAREQALLRHVGVAAVQLVELAAYLRPVQLGRELEV